MAEKQLEITESDEAGNATATYVQSATKHDGTSRVDVVVRLHSRSSQISC